MINEDLINKFNFYKQRIPILENRIKKLEDSNRRLSNTLKIEYLKFTRHCIDRFVERIADVSVQNAHDILSKTGIRKTCREDGTYNFTSGKLNFRYVVESGSVVTIIPNEYKVFPEIEDKFSLLEDYMNYRIELIYEKIVNKKKNRFVTFDNYIKNNWKLI